MFNNSSGKSGIEEQKNRQCALAAKLCYICRRRLELATLQTLLLLELGTDVVQVRSEQFGALNVVPLVELLVDRVRGVC